MYTYGDKLIAGNNGALVVFSDVNNNFYIEPGLNINNIAYENGTYWAARGNNGLSGFRINDSDKTITMNVSSIIPDSPKRNFIYHMKLAGDRLLIAGGQTSSGNERTGTIMTMEDNNWASFQEEGIADATNLPYRHITDTVQYPRDDRLHSANSF